MLCLSLVQLLPVPSKVSLWRNATNLSRCAGIGTPMRALSAAFALQPKTPDSLLPRSYKDQQTPCPVGCAAQASDPRLSFAFILRSQSVRTPSYRCALSRPVAPYSPAGCSSRGWWRASCPPCLLRGLRFGTAYDSASRNIPTPTQWLASFVSSVTPIYHFAKCALVITRPANLPSLSLRVPPVVRLEQTPAQNRLKA